MQSRSGRPSRSSHTLSNPFQRPAAPSALIGLVWACTFALSACAPAGDGGEGPEAGAGGPEEAGPDSARAAGERPAPQFSLGTERTHNRFSRTIPPVLRVPSGAVVEVFTKEATDGQLTPESNAADLAQVSFDPVHPLTGPVFVEGAEPGDVLAVTLHEIELGDWGWAAVVPGFGFLADEFPQPWLRTWRFDGDQDVVRFDEGIELPLRPFPGVLGVAPATDSLLVTIPPRANGGNMDNHHLVEGTTVYFPVFVRGALLSIGDTHAVQGDGEISGTAIESPMRIVYEVNVLKGGRRIAEPEYETDDYYAVTAFGTTLDEAAKKASRYMISYLVEVRGMHRTDAYVLCSLAGDLKISEVVDVPHVLVSMHMPKAIFTATAAEAGTAGDSAAR